MSVLLVIDIMSLLHVLQRFHQNQGAWERVVLFPAKVSFPVCGADQMCACNQIIYFQLKNENYDEYYLCTQLKSIINP